MTMVMTGPAELVMGGRGPSTRDVSLWSGAAVLVVAAHLAFAYALGSQESVPTFDAVEPALEIDLSQMLVTTPDAVESKADADTPPLDQLEPVQETVEPLSDQPETLAMAEPEAVEQVEPLERVEAAEPEQVIETTPDEAMESAVEPTAVAEPEPVEPDIAALVPEITESEVFEAVNPEVVLPVVAPTPEPKVDVEKVEPQPETKVAEKVERKPKAEPKLKTEPKPKAEKPVEKPRKAAEKPKAKAETAKVAEKPAKSQPAPKSEASVKSTASKAPSISPARWQSKVVAWINRHKGRPKDPSLRAARGEVLVSFAINASGSVISTSVARSSGNPGLDRAAMDIVRRSSPVPAPPPELARGRIPLAVPIQFNGR